MELFPKGHHEEQLSEINGHCAPRKGSPPTPNPSPRGGGGRKGPEMYQAQHYGLPSAPDV